MPTRVYAANTEVEAGMVESLLRANGLHPNELQKSHHILRAGVDQYYYVEVPDHEVTKAIQILIDHDLKHIVHGKAKK